jgi:L-ascorbate metabolism protein UlaG (beta-lactamase superfamily)
MRPVLLTLLIACGESKPPTPAEPPPAPPAEPAPAPAPPPAPVATPATPDTIGDLTVMPLYHGTVALQAGGKTWVVDPWGKAPLGDLKADVVLVTDIHPDHLDPAALDQVRKEGTIVVAPKAVADQTKVDVVMANGDTKEIAGTKVTAVPMYNLQRGPEPGKLFHDRGRGNGYLLELGGKRVYIAGDTECTPEMKALKNIDVAFVPMNLPYTMPPDEAAACVKAFAPKILYPYHYTDADLSKVQEMVGPGTEVRLREWYPGGQPTF